MAQGSTNCAIKMQFFIKNYYEYYCHTKPWFVGVMRWDLMVDINWSCKTEPKWSDDKGEQKGEGFYKFCTIMVSSKTVGAGYNAPLIIDASVSFKML